LGGPGEGQIVTVGKGKIGAKKQKAKEKQHKNQDVKKEK